MIDVSIGIMIVISVTRLEIMLTENARQNHFGTLTHSTRQYDDRHLVKIRLKPFNGLSLSFETKG